MPFSEAAKNAMLDALEPDGVKLHDGDPGAAGTDNEVSSIESASFSSASGGERVLASQVDFTSLTPSDSVTHFSVWDGATFLGSGARTDGDAAVNAAGEYSLTTATKLDINDS